MDAAILNIHLICIRCVITHHIIYRYHFLTVKDSFFSQSCRFFLSDFRQKSRKSSRILRKTVRGFQLLPVLYPKISCCKKHRIRWFHSFITHCPKVICSYKFWHYKDNYEFTLIRKLLLCGPCFWNPSTQSEVMWQRHQPMSLGLQCWQRTLCLYTCKTVDLLTYLELSHWQGPLMWITHFYVDGEKTNRIG